MVQLCSPTKVTKATLAIISPALQLKFSTFSLRVCECVDFKSCELDTQSESVNFCPISTTQSLLSPVHALPKNAFFRSYC